MKVLKSLLFAAMLTVFVVGAIKLFVFSEDQKTILFLITILIEFSLSLYAAFGISAGFRADLTNTVHFFVGSAIMFVFLTHLFFGLPMAQTVSVAVVLAVAFGCIFGYISGKNLRGKIL